MIRSIVFWITTTFATIFVCPLIFLYRRKKGAIRILQNCWGRLLLWVSGARLEIEGTEHIPAGQPYIIMSNHQSYHDIFVIGSLPVFIHWMAKKELFKIPVFGWILKWIDAISIDRDNVSKASSSIRRAVGRIREGATVLIFPEGTRSPTGELLPFNEGGFFLAILSRVPIVPVTISGTHHVMPKGSLRVSPGVVRVTISRPVATDSFALKDHKVLQDQIRAVFTENLCKSKDSSLAGGFLT